MPGTGPVLQAHQEGGQGQYGEIQLHTPQLLPGPEHPSYAGAAVEVMEGLDGWLTVRHQGRILAAQEAPPSPAFLRNGHGGSASVPVPPSDAHRLGEHWTAAPEPLDPGVEDENGHGMITASKPAAGSPSKPTFLQKERWKAIQKARGKGISMRAIERELGIHRATIKKYLNAEGPPTRQSCAGPTTSDTITA